MPSKTQGSKDIIKIKEVHFKEEDANRLALFAPQAVVNRIRGFEVVEKMRLTLPEAISEVFRCPNHNCASHGEPVKSRFYIATRGSDIRLKCHYCEKTFERESVAEA